MNTRNVNAITSGCALSLLTTDAVTYAALGQFGGAVFWLTLIGITLYRMRTL